MLYYDSTEKRHILCLKTGRFAGQKFITSMSICNNPLCGCANIDFECIPSDAGPARVNEVSARLCFSLDAGKRQIARSDELPEASPSLHLARAVFDELQDADWRELYQFLFGVKQSQIREADVEELDAVFPEEVMAEKGSMTAYTEIFPFGSSFYFNTAREHWIADDQYCVNPRCKCHGAILTFFCLPERPELVKKLTYENMPAVLYDCDRHNFEVIKPSRSGQPPIEELIRSLRTAHPEFEREIGQRQEQLRILFMRARRNKPAADTAFAPSKPKIGRNEPCPCGSGKKFKRCCGK